MPSEFRAPSKYKDTESGLGKDREILDILRIELVGVQRIQAQQFKHLNRRIDSAGVVVMIVYKAVAS